MPILQVRLTEDEMATLKVKAAHRHTSMTGLIRDWIGGAPMATETEDEKVTADPPLPKPKAKAPVEPTPVKSTPQRPTENSYAAFRPVPKPGTKR